MSCAKLVAYRSEKTFEFVPRENQLIDYRLKTEVFRSNISSIITTEMYRIVADVKSTPRLTTSHPVNQTRCRGINETAPLFFMFVFESINYYYNCLCRERCDSNCELLHCTIRQMKSESMTDDACESGEKSTSKLSRWRCRREGKCKNKLLPPTRQELPTYLHKPEEVEITIHVFPEAWELWFSGASLLLIRFRILRLFSSCFYAVNYFLLQDLQ